MDARWWRGSIGCQKSKVERVYKYNSNSEKLIWGDVSAHMHGQEIQWYKLHTAVEHFLLHEPK